MENVSIKHNKRSKNLEINISKFFTVENIDDLKANLQNSLENSKEINLNLQTIDNIDIGGIQFIYALQKEATERKIKFNLSFDGNDEISILLKKTGFENFLLTNNNNKI